MTIVKEMQLKLFEITVLPHPAAGDSVRTVHVLILAKGSNEARYFALKSLNMIDSVILNVDVSEIEGPFESGRILSVRES